MIILTTAKTSYDADVAAVDETVENHAYAGLVPHVVCAFCWWWWMADDADFCC